MRRRPYSTDVIPENTTKRDWHVIRSQLRGSRICPLCHRRFKSLSGTAQHLNKHIKDEEG